LKYDQKLNKITAIFITLSLLFSVVTWATTNTDEIKRKERELNEIKEKIEALDASLDENQSLQNETNIKIKTISNSIRTLESELTTLDNNIEETENAIVVKEIELEEAEIKISDKNDLLNKRLRVMYKVGDVGYLEVLFGSKDFTDLLSRIHMIQQILEHDQDLIVEFKAQRDDIALKKVELESTKEDLINLFEGKKTKQGELEKNLNSLVAYKEDLSKSEAALTEAENELENEANQLTTLIKNLELSATYVGGEMMWPVPGNSTITSSFGNRVHPITKVVTMHTGIDISCPLNTEIVAAQSGTIIYSDWYGGYGKVIMIDHGGGYATLYGHNNSLIVTVGDVVKKGDVISKSGSTGFSTGPHLHFEVRINGDYVDPIPYLKGN